MLSDAARVALVAAIFLSMPLSAGSVVATESHGSPEEDDDRLIFRYAAERADDPSEALITLSVHAPSGIVSVTVSDLPDEAEVVGADGFQPDSGAYRWDQQTDPPTITYRVPVEQHLYHFDEPDYAATEEWAFFNIGRYEADHSYSYRGDDPGSTTVAAAAEPGHAGVAFVFLGDHDLYHAPGGEVDLVVPQAAAPPTDPETLSYALMRSHAMLDVREQSPAVNAFVTTDPIRGGGLAPWTERHGQRDFRVGDTSRGDKGPYNTWLHEFIHTRQQLDLADDMDWFAEGSARYYEGYLAMHLGYTSFDRFHRYAETTDHEDVVLAQNEDFDPQYTKGRRVLAALDAEIRQSTDGEATLDDVFRRMNAYNGEIDQEVFTDMVVDVTDDRRFVGWVDRFVASEAAPVVPHDPELFRLNGRVSDAEGAVGTSAPPRLSRNAEVSPATGPRPAEVDGRLGCGRLLAAGIAR